jgi:PEGA domain
MKKLFSLVAIVIAGAALHAPAQDLPQKAVDRAKARIRQGNPRISDDVLNEDIRVIQRVYPDVEARYKGRVGTENLQSALLRQWVIQRTGPRPANPNRSLNPDAFKKQMFEMGILVVNSDPSDAEIFIDGQDTGKKTPQTFLINAGTYTVKCVKGCLTDQQTAVVKPGEATTVNLTLK